MPSFLRTHPQKLEDLYVKPEHRANGVGKALFAELGRVAQEKVSVQPPYRWRNITGKTLELTSLLRILAKEMREDGLGRLEGRLIPFCWTRQGA